MRNGTNRIDGDDRKDREDEINEIDGIDGKFPSSAALLFIPSSAALPFIPAPVHLNQREIKFLLEGVRFGLSQK